MVWRSSSPFPHPKCWRRCHRHGGNSTSETSQPPSRTADGTGLRHYFTRVIPAPSGEAEITIVRTYGDRPLGYKLADDVPGDWLDEEGRYTQVPPGGWAREANANPYIEQGTIVLVTFVGYDDDNLPAFLFTYGPPPAEEGVPMHDHRSNYYGGLAFAVYHPGTSLPQQPWAI